MLHRMLGDMQLHSKDTVALSCPEGDTSMHVSKEEADDVFLCPKHSLPLEPQKRMIRRIHIDRDGD